MLISQCKFLALSLLIFLLFLWGVSGKAIASAVLPNTSVFIIEEANKEGEVGIKNTENEPVLLYSKIIRLDDDNIDAALIPVPAAVLVQPGETQIIRVLYRNNNKLDREHLARITFLGIPPKEEKNGKIHFMVGQDLPLIIRPKGYTAVDDKWQYLKWHIKNQQLCVANDTKMVIRFVNIVMLLPSNVPINMPKPYSLPESELCVKLPENYVAQVDTQVRFSAMTDYNYMVDGRTSPVQIDMKKAKEAH